MNSFDKFLRTNSRINNILHIRLKVFVPALAIGLYPGPWLDLVASVGPYLLALGQVQ